jgi:hypothetical protein
VTAALNSEMATGSLRVGSGGPDRCNPLRLMYPATVLRVVPSSVAIFLKLAPSAHITSARCDRSSVQKGAFFRASNDSRCARFRSSDHGRYGVNSMGPVQILRMRAVYHGARNSSRSTELAHASNSGVTFPDLTPSPARQSFQRRVTVLYHHLRIARFTIYPLSAQHCPARGP